MDGVNSLGDKIKTLRLKRNFSQKDLAQKIGVDVSMIGLYENGFRKPSLQTLIRIAYVFGVSTDYLLGVEPPSHAVLDVSGLTIEQILAIQNIIESYKKANGRE